MSGFVDKSRQFVYNGTMKQVKKPQIRMVRSKINHDDLYYTVSTWETQMIDGVEFLAVTKIKPYDSNVAPKVYMMKKDNMEFVK